MKKLASFAVAVAALATWQPHAEAAGNITVDLKDGVLSIVGDQESNDIIIRELGGFYFIGGNGSDYDDHAWRWLFPQIWESVPATTVNGNAEPIVLDPDQTSGITDIVVVGGGGDELLWMIGYFDANVHVDCGAGRDRVTFLTLADEITGDLSIDAGKDDDDVDISWLLVHGNVDISTGHGSDRIILSGPTVFRSDASINAGLHDDLLVARGDNFVAGNLLVHMGQGDDIVGDFFGGSDWEVDGSALLHGGQGFDLLSGTSGLSANPLEIVGFESP